MRRLITALMILSVVLIAGLSALILFVSPNDFREYMVRQVQARSGYQLTLEGPLRWHVWPRLSILSGRMSLTAPGADLPILSAANMRLDVELLPLFSHQLKVSQVMVKRAVIQLTPQTKEQSVKNAPIAPKMTTPLPGTEQGWSFDIGELSIDDSLMVFEREPGDQITMRNINLSMSQDAHHQANMTFSGSINCNQRDLDIQFDAALDGSNYPASLSASLSALNYKISGAGLPGQGISGQGTVTGHWNAARETLSFSQIKMSANDSDIEGKMSVVLSSVPVWDMALHASRLNLDNLLVARNKPGVNTGSESQAPIMRRPIISQIPPDNSISGLARFNAQVALSAKSLIWHGLALSNLNTQLSSQNGLLAINTLRGELDKGSFSLSGNINARQIPAVITLKPELHNLNLRHLLVAFNYPQVLSGYLTLNGTFTGNQLNASNFRNQWQGHAQAKVSDMRLEGMNFLGLIEQAIARNNENVNSEQNDEMVTMLKTFTTQLQLDRGELKLRNITGASPVLALTGQGEMNLVTQQCDTQLAVQATFGWKGESELKERLKNTVIPLRIYGPWSALNYHLDVDKVLRNTLQDEAKMRLKAWSERNQNAPRAKNAN